MVIFATILRQEPRTTSCNSIQMKNIPVRQLTPSPAVLSAPERFKIRRVEDILGEQDLFHDLHRHDFYFILALTSGTGVHQVDFQDYEVHDHAVFFLRPGQVHQLHLHAGSKGYLLEFNAEFYQPTLKSPSHRFTGAGNKNYYDFESARYDKTASVMALMYQEFTNREEGYRDVIQSGLDIFFVELMRQGALAAHESSPANNYTQERFEDFQELLEKHIATHKQVSHYTKMMNLSAYQLNEITKSSIGKTASDMINEHILLEAKRYLLATPSQVKEIADHLGYEDTSYFIRFFKKHIGYSPEAFRQHFR